MYPYPMFTDPTTVEFWIFWIVVALLQFALSFLILYLLLRTAIFHGMRAHTIWKEKNLPHLSGKTADY